MEPHDAGSKQDNDCSNESPTNDNNIVKVEVEVDVACHNSFVVEIEEIKRPRQTCKICGYTCIRGLKRHLAKHSGEKPYMCDKCDYRSAQLSHLKSHQLKHTGEKPFKCDICDYRSTKACNLKDHMTNHTGEKPYKCDLCDYKTAKLPHLRDHVLTHTGGGKRYKCYICDYTTIRIGNLKRHLHTHSINLGQSEKRVEKKEFACHICSYKTDRGSNLKRHMFSHTGEKPHKCDYCDYRASHKSELKKHVLRHTGEKPHKCEYCDFRTTRRTQLNEHIEKLHIDKVFTCDLCTFKTLNLNHWKQHLRIHTFVSSHLNNILTPQIFLETGVNVNQTSDVESSIANDSNDGMDGNTSKSHNQTGPKSYLKQEYYQTGLTQGEDNTSASNQDANAESFRCDMCDFETKTENDMKHHALAHLPAERPGVVK